MKRFLYIRVAGWIILLTALSACGSKPEREPAPSPAPSAVPTVVPTPINDHLERYAKITATSQASDDYAPDMVADGKLGWTASDASGFVWVPEGNPNDDRIRLEWNSQVTLSSLKIFDNPMKDEHVKGGTVYFFNDANLDENMNPVTFGELPDNGSGGLSVAIPSSIVVTAIEIAITSHLGGLAGIAEIYVGGARVEEAIAEENISPFGHVIAGSSVDVLNPLHSGTDSGMNRTRKALDEDETTEWVSDGLGANASYELEFDKRYLIKAITLVDRADTTQRFLEATVRFTEEDVVNTLTKTVGDDSATLTFDPPVAADRLRIEFSKVVTGATYVGFSEINIVGSYAP